MINTNKRFETWYRGFNKEYGIYGEETPHLLWLTTDYNYAKEFGDTIMEYRIDMSKCHGSIEGMGYLFDFDMSEGPSEEYASYLLNEYGVNSYCYYGGLTESSYCMCLWDETPIVSQRILDNNKIKESKNMKNNVIKLNENTLKQIVSESVKKVLKEDDSFNFYKDKEDKSGELTKKILFLRSNAVQLYEFIKKGNGIWGYRVGDSEEMQQERLELANDVVRAINRLYKSVNEADFNDSERWNKFGV